MFANNLEAPLMRAPNATWQHRASARVELRERLAGHHALEQPAGGTLLVAVGLERDRGPGPTSPLGLRQLGNVDGQLAAVLLIRATAEQKPGW
jgi:hypothetical protein